MNNTCVLIHDLLPLYVDGLCSPEAAKQIEHHLAHCPACAAEAAAMQTPLAAPEPEAPRQPKAPFLKIKRHYFERALAVALVFGLFAPTFFWTFSMLRGGGFGFASFGAYFDTKAVCRAIEKGNYERAAEGMLFFDATDADTARPTSGDEFVHRMAALSGQDISIKNSAFELTNFVLRDGFMTGVVMLTVEHGGQEYQLRYKTSYQNKQVAFFPDPMVFGPKANGGYPAVYTPPGWVNALDGAMANYFPG